MLENIDDELFVELEEKGKNSEDILHLRYNRQKRLENAPEEVKLLHSSKYIKRQSLFSCIWNNRGHRFIFMAIILLSALNLGLYFYNYNESHGKINGVKVEIQPFQYNNELLVNVIFHENKQIEEDGREINVILKAFNKKGEEIYASKALCIYIGARLISHFKIEGKDVGKIEATILDNKKILILKSKV